jgi:hypothetical protein
MVSESGVGTICTLNGHSVLGEGLKFNPCTIETYVNQTEGYQYGIIVADPDSKITRWDDKKKKLFMLPETCVSTSIGWLSAKELHAHVTHKKGHIPVFSIKTFWVRCLVCTKLYMPGRPMQSVCSYFCMRAAKSANILTFKPLHAQSVPHVMEEKFVALAHVIQHRLPIGVEVSKVASVENGSAYINGILCSSLSLLGRV